MSVVHSNGTDARRAPSAERRAKEDPMTENRRHVVVGIDTGPGSDLALWSAVDEARLRRLPLRIVCAYTWAIVLGSVPVYGDEPDIGVEGIRAIAERTVEEAVRRVSDAEPGWDVSGAAVEGDPVEVLLAEAESADVVVLGSRHLHAVGSFLLGSVGTQVAARAACPVLVTRGAAIDPTEGAYVVVGVDATAESSSVLAFAFDEASRRGAPLHAVLCWHPRTLTREWFTPDWIARSRTEAEIWLSEGLAGWREKYPDVAVSSGVLDQHPVTGLVEASMGSVMLVVGSRHHARVVGALPGLTARAVLHHAVSPVAIVPLPAP
jgi:nucleotide-binding universal stress UspA family protein